MTMMPWLQNPNANQPGLGKQFAEKAATKLAADQIGKLGLQAAGTAAAGPLGGAAAGALGELAAPLAGQLVSGLFNKGGAVYKQDGGGLPAGISPELAALINAFHIGNAQRQIDQGHATGYGDAPKQIKKPDLYKLPKEKVKEQPQKKVTAPVPVFDAPRSKGSAQWNVPLGKLFGADWSTQGSYADMDRGKDPLSAMLSGTWTFNKGGEVPGWWDKAKSAAKHAWKNDNLSKGEGRWSKSKPQYKAIGGLTSGPLGMSDLQVAGKDKAISKVKMKKSKGDMAEEVEYSYHPPLAAKPKPTGE